MGKISSMNELSPRDPTLRPLPPEGQGLADTRVTSTGSVNHGPAPMTRTAARRSSRLRISPNLFSISAAIAVLAQAWQLAQPTLKTPQAVPDVLNGISAAVWLVILGAYVAQGPRRMVADLSDRIFAPFLALANMTGMMLALGLDIYAPGVARVFLVIFLIATVALGGELMSRWLIDDDLEVDALHSAYFVPVVAAPLLGAFAAGEMHLHTVAEAAFGLGFVSWLLLGALMLNRHMVRPRLPAVIIPTMAIQIAPPALAGIAYAALTHSRLDLVASSLGGYTVLMAVVQLRLLPVYLKLKFNAAFWAFGIAYSVAGTDALVWIGMEHPAGAVVYTAIVIAGISALILALAVRTAMAAVTGELFRMPDDTH